MQQQSLCQGQQRRGLLAPLRAGEGQIEPYDEPETAREAIEVGQRLCASQQWSAALAIFEKAIKLPGTGMKRFRC